MNKNILIASLIFGIATMMVLSSLPADAFTLTGDDDVPDVDKKKKKKKKKTGHRPIALCHVTGSSSNPYVLIVVDIDAARKHFEHGDIRPTLDRQGELTCPGPGQVLDPR